MKAIEAKQPKDAAKVKASFLSFAALIISCAPTIAEWSNVQFLILHSSTKRPGDALAPEIAQDFAGGVVAGRRRINMEGET